MKNAIATIALVLLFGCAAPVPAPTLCQLPPHLGGWKGARLRLTGVVIGTFEHGYILKGIGCDNAVNLDGVDDAMSNQAWDGQNNGHLFADVSGTIVRNPRFRLGIFPPESPYQFRISRVHQWRQVKGRPDEGLDM